MSETDTSAGWQLDLAEDVDLPGWVWLPEDLDEAERRGWVEEILPALLELVTDQRAGVAPGPEAAEIRGLVDAGLDSRAESESYAMYMVWPVRAPAAVMCHVNLARTEDLPSWDQFEGRMHPIEARNLGPGVQITTELTVESDEGPADLVRVAYIFADEEAAIVLHLEPSLPQLVGPAMMSIGMFINALAVTKPDASPFLAEPSTAPMIASDEWPSNEEGVS